ncbi:MAG: TonB-dependent receptor [Rhodospirillaceae bacterium]|nr:TonB-dependent receptor [Rhodospirillaceae bacterium]
MKNRDYRCLLASATMLSTAAIVGAQDVMAQFSIEEITVTTRRRAESLQDIPMSIQAFTAVQIERGGIRDVEDVARMTPGLTFDKGFAPQDTRPSIRGLPATRGRPPVGILLDGIDISSQSLQTAGGGNLMNMRLVDVERIEVVKGPQSALYGRVAFGGAINYISKKPSDELTSSIFLDSGNHGQLEVRGSISTPLDEDGDLGVRLNAAYAQHDGYHSNTVTNEGIGGFDSVGVSGVFQGQLTEKFRATARIAYSEDTSDVRAEIVKGGSVRVAAPANPLGLTGANMPKFGDLSIGDNDIIQLSVDPFTNKDFFGTESESLVSSLKLEWDISDNVSVMSLTGYNDADARQNFDSDKRGKAIGRAFLPSPGGIAETLPRATIIDFTTNTKQFSQEIRISDLESEGFRWAVGGMYWEETTVQLSQSNATVDFTGIGSAGLNLALVGRSGLNDVNLDRETEHLSAYGHIEYDISDKLTLTAEARYSDENFTYDVDGSGNNAFGTMFRGPIKYSAPFSLPVVSAGDSYFTPRVSLAYQVSDDVMIYASAAKGAKPGGYSTLGIGSDLQNNRYRPETLWSYEAGAKTQFADGRVQLNGALFFMDYTDKQVTTQDASGGQGINLGTITKNAGAAEIKGLEADMSLAVTEFTSLNAAYTYLDTEYTNFVFNTLSGSDIVRAGNCTTSVQTSANGTPVTTCEASLTGNQLERQPKHAITFSANTTFPITDSMDMIAEVAAQYQGTRFLTHWNRWTMPSYMNVDLRIGVETDDWSIITYADNLLGSDKIRSGQENFDLFSFGIALNLFVPDDRQLGVRFSYSM